MLRLLRFARATTAWPARFAIAALVAGSLGMGCATSRGPSRPADLAGLGEQEGLASYYADRFHGQRTASGERYDRAGLTAAHRTLPFGTRIRVTNLANGRTIVLRVNDRGPVPRARIVDVTALAARKLGFMRQGVTRVKLEVLGANETAAN